LEPALALPNRWGKQNRFKKHCISRKNGYDVHVLPKPSPSKLKQRRTLGSYDELPRKRSARMGKRVEDGQEINEFIGQLLWIVANFERASGRRLIDILQSGEFPMDGLMRKVLRK
jgi:hypothetical protein